MNIFRNGSFYLCFLIAVISDFSSFSKDQKPPQNSAQAKNKDETYLNLFKNIYSKIDERYVDEVDSNKVIEAGIKGMLNSLDPYSKFLTGDGKKRLEMLTKGKYGGVGMHIAKIGGVLTVISPMEGSPAEKMGLKPGDQVIKVDSQDISQMSVKESSNLIKGEMGSKVILSVVRPSLGDSPKDIALTRSQIKVNDVPYWAVDENYVAYIKINRFSKFAAKDFKEALQSISLQTISGLIIDLRGNSGGLLRNAISILDYLLPKKQLLLTVRGKNEKVQKTYYSENDPILSMDIPVAVLINRSSASASEIVSGALQDLDRAVVIGEKSFGKGLVQKIFPLNDKSTLKITTAKYYIPSGRLIQSREYINEDILINAKKDVDEKFMTTNGRVVKSGDGINPDVFVSPKKHSPYVLMLANERAFLRFAAKYAPSLNKKLPIVIDDSDIKLFEEFVSKINHRDFLLPGEKSLDDLDFEISRYLENKNIFKDFSIYDKDQSKEEFDALQKALTVLKDSFQKRHILAIKDYDNKNYIKQKLREEYSLILMNQKEKMRIELFDDRIYEKAKEIFLDIEEYLAIVKPQNITD